MSRWTIVLAARSGGLATTDWLAAANGLTASGVTSIASPANEDRKGRGELIWSLTLPGDATPDQSEPVAALLDETGPVTVVDTVPVDPIATGIVSRLGARVLRTLLIRVRPGTADPLIAELEETLVAMPEHIDSINSWALSRLDPAQHESGWTHLWEQEFDDATGFRPYMAHPFHWTGVERWFDPEIPGHIVQDEAHYISPIPGAVLLA